MRKVVKFIIGIVACAIWLIGLYALWQGIFNWWGITAQICALMISTVGWWYIMKGLY